VEAVRVAGERWRYLNEIDARTIRVEGCALSILCGGENMTRIK
jgi:hypothetical protein